MRNPTNYIRLNILHKTNFRSVFKSSNNQLSSIGFLHKGPKLILFQPEVPNVLNTHPSQQSHVQSSHFILLFLLLTLSRQISAGIENVGLNRFH